MNFSTKNHEHKKQNKNVVSKTTFLKTALLLITALFINCTDDDNLSQDQLPPITQNGANTFGAIVDGRVFIPANSFSTTPGNSEFKGLRTLIGKDFINSNGDDKFTMLSGNFKINPNIYIYIYTYFKK
ncbi:hypothetical protein [Polaribacter aestuariivivens]|uniref:hypothetical protein n=1 Tax=Polaribacter aestuariivivens TaxID=2304626 RepID=UPI003F4945FA